MFMATVHSGKYFLAVPFNSFCCILAGVVSLASALSAAVPKCDYMSFVDGSTNVGAHTLTSTTANFQATDSGKLIVVEGAGAGGADLAATMTYVGSTSITLSPSPATAVTGASFAYGTDDTSAIQTGSTNALSSGGLVALPNYKKCGVTALTAIMDNTTLSCLGCTLGHLSISANLLTVTNKVNFTVQGVNFDPGAGGNSTNRNATVYVDTATNFLMEDSSIIGSVPPPPGNAAHANAKGGFFSTGSSGSFLRNTVKNVLGQQVWIYANGTDQQFHVIGNVLDGTMYNAIYIYSFVEQPNYAEVASNYITNTGYPVGSPNQSPGNGSNGNCIVIYRSDNANVHDNTCLNALFSGVRLNKARNVNVAHNRVEGAHEGSMYAELGAEGNLFIGNFITHCASGILLTNLSDRPYGVAPATPMLSLKNVAIGNTVWACTAHAFEVEDDIVVNNRIVDCPYGILAGYGLTGHDITIKDNEFVNSGGIDPLFVPSGGSGCTGGSVSFVDLSGTCQNLPVGSYQAITPAQNLTITNAGSGCKSQADLKTTFAACGAQPIPNLSLHNMIAAIVLGTGSTNQRILLKGNVVVGPPDPAHILPTNGYPIYSYAAFSLSDAPHIVNIVPSGSNTTVTLARGDSSNLAMGAGTAKITFSDVSGLTKLNGLTATVQSVSTATPTALYIANGGLNYAPAGSGMGQTNAAVDPATLTGCTNSAPSVNLTISSKGVITGATLGAAFNPAGCNTFPQILVSNTGNGDAALYMTLDFVVNVNSSAFNQTYQRPLAFNRFPLAVVTSPLPDFPASVRLGDGALTPGVGLSLAAAATISVSNISHPLTTSGAMTVSAFQGVDGTANGPYGLQPNEVITFYCNSCNSSGTDVTFTGTHIKGSTKITGPRGQSFQWDGINWWPI